MKACCSITCFTATVSPVVQFLNTDLSTVQRQRCESVIQCFEDLFRIRSELDLQAAEQNVVRTTPKAPLPMGSPSWRAVFDESGAYRMES